MIGLTVASVPLYDLFCKVTGFQGFNKSQDIDEQISFNEDEKLPIKFYSDVVENLDWNFESPENMTIAIGKKYEVIFRAKNNSDVSTIGTSTFNILPPKIGPYFMKIECFCFQEQEISPQEIVEFPVVFYIDPLMYDDPEAMRTKNVTLSYTFFPKTS